MEVTEIGTTVLVAVLRESVSLGILLIFGFFAYQLMKELLQFLREWGTELIEVLRDIADTKRP